MTFTCIRNYKTSHALGTLMGSYALKIIIATCRNHNDITMHYKANASIRNSDVAFVK